MDNKQQLLDDELDNVSGGTSTTNSPKYNKDDYVWYNRMKCTVKEYNLVNNQYFYTLVRVTTPRTYWNIAESQLTPATKEGRNFDMP